MDEDMVNLLDVAARVIDLLDEADRELLARFCVLSPVVTLSREARLEELTRLGYDLDVLASAEGT